MNIYRYTLNSKLHSQYKYLKALDFGDREDNNNYSNFRLLSDVSRNYLGTSTEKAADFDYAQLLDADLIILVSASYIGDNVDGYLDCSDIFTEPRYKRYQDMILPTSVFGDTFLTAGTFLDIPTLFVGTSYVDSIEKYGKSIAKSPYYIVSHRDSIMGVLTEINLKKDAEVFIIVTDKHHHDTKHTNIVLKQVEKELKLYARMID